MELNMEEQDHEEQQNTNYWFGYYLMNYFNESEKLKMNKLQIIESIEKELLKNMPSNLSSIDNLFALKGLINSEELNLNKLKLMINTIKSENPKSENNINSYQKEEKEALLKELEAKTMILNELKIEHLELKEKMEKYKKEISDLNRKNNKNFYSKDEYLSLKLEYLNKKEIIKELNDKLRKYMEENKQKSEILKINGIKDFAGIGFKMTRDEIIENYINENERLERQNQNLKEMADDASQKKKIIKEYLNFEKEKELKNKKYQKEISNLKSEKEKNEKEYEKEIRNLKLENEELKSTIKNIKRNNNNSINNISINNMIDTKEYITLKKEVDELKQKCDLLSGINIESLKRSCFEAKSKEGEYDKSAMESLFKKCEELSNLKIDFPIIDKLIQNYVLADYNYKETKYNYNLLISKVKEFLLTNNKKAKYELSKLVGL
jgi:hypothetical protein